LIITKTIYCQKEIKCFKSLLPRLFSKFLSITNEKVISKISKAIYKTKATTDVVAFAYLLAV
jgi:hypothetical protein